VLIITRPEELVLGRGAMERDNAFDARIESRTYTGETTEFVVAVEGLKQEFEVVVPGNVGFDDLDRKTKIGWNAEQGIAYDQLSVSDAVAVDDLIEV
jgi:ABC-type Fe3+/spermidine/putrescine transport system ATPase subunit